jgi:hypothetical protein
VGRQKLQKYLVYMAGISIPFSQNNMCLQLTSGSAGIREMGNATPVVPSTVMMAKLKVFSSAFMHKHATVSCDVSTATTTTSMSNHLTRLMDFFSISRAIKKRLGLISEATKAACV